MSNLGKLKVSHLYIYDRLHKRVTEEESNDLDGPQTSAEFTHDSKIHLKDDGLGKYNISPLGHIKGLKDMVRNLLW